MSRGYLCARADTSVGVARCTCAVGKQCIRVLARLEAISGTAVVTGFWNWVIIRGEEGHIGAHMGSQATPSEGRVRYV